MQGCIGMTRLPVGVALSFVLVATATASAESPKKTIAQRLSSLRDGWSFGSNEETTDVPPAVQERIRVAQRTKQPVTQPITPRTAPSTTGSQAATATDQRAPFPRVNPSELMPRNWFGKATPKPAPKAKVKATPARPATPPQPTAGTIAPVKTPASSAAASARGSAGSARARLLRDMQRTPVEALAPEAAAVKPRGTQARAGSAFSPNAPQTTPSRRAIAAQNARLARSIAAEVAESIGSDSKPSKSQAKVAAVPAKPAPDAVGPIDTDEQVVTVEGPTPTETDALANTEVEDDITPIQSDSTEESTPANTVAESDSGRILVAEKTKKTRKLPLFIGDRYSDYENGSTVETSKPAAEAFAKASPIKTVVETPKVEAPEDDLLFTQRMPVLVSKVLGPKTITVGREATYRVLLANRGDVGADKVVTRITIPDGAEVVGTKAAKGTIDRDASVPGTGTLVWRTEHLAASGMAKLDVRLIARTGNPIELGVAHTHQPIDGRTLVQVQEPKLALEIVGPDEVLYGKPQTFRLTISNPGTGAAENVRLHLTPPGGDVDRRTSHDFGLIPAGDESTVEIELTAREAGQLAINASADADGDVTCDLTKEVFCRRPQLVVDWRGPTDRYAGAPAVYYFRVRNPGTAVAPGVVLSVDLPEGFEVLPGGDTPAVENNRIAYRAGSLRPGDDKYFELRGVLRRDGANDITLRAAGSDETRSERVVATTEVVALADLKLDVLDPKGPVATDQEIAYEIRVTNRGSNDAHDVRVIGLFSEGIEPHHVEGALSETVDGRVEFDVIDRIAAGEQRVFTIHARAYEEGTHLFRAEVLCRDLEIKLAAEETTRFFHDEAIDVAADGYPTGGTNSLYPR
ncbi:MAG: CARDB domain-containing protein [Planctomycetota bacterium]